jgi:hypothetical protein
MHIFKQCFNVHNLQTTTACIHRVPPDKPVYITGQILFQIFAKFANNCEMIPAYSYD